MQGDQNVNSETGLLSSLKGASVWIITGIANWLANISANQVAVWLSIAYTTLLIVSWFKREFRTPARQHRVTDEAETIKATKVIVELPEPPEILIQKKE